MEAPLHAEDSPTSESEIDGLRPMRVWACNPRQCRQPGAGQETHQVGNDLRPDGQEALDALFKNSLSPASAGGRAANAAFYPLPLITEILRGIRDTQDFEQPDLDKPSQDVQLAMARVANLQDQPPSLLASLREEAHAKATAHLTTDFKNA